MVKAIRSRFGGRIYRDRLYRYQVMYRTRSGHIGVFAETDDPFGRSEIAFAKLVPWIRSTWIQPVLGVNRRRAGGAIEMNASAVDGRAIPGAAQTKPAVSANGRFMLAAGGVR